MDVVQELVAVGARAVIVAVAEVIIAALTYGCIAVLGKKVNREMERGQ